jgi:subtilisin-like proprotein convertase family protein
MMAIYTASGGPISNYAIIASDRATDVFVRQNVDGFLQIANNSSFIGDSIPLDPNYELEVVNSPDILFVTNGRPARGPGPATGPGLMYRGDNRNTSPGAAGYQGDAVVGRQTFFSLSNGNINLPVFDLDFDGRKIPIVTSIPNPFPSEEYQVSGSVQGELRYDPDADGKSDVWQFEVSPTGQVFFREAQRFPGSIAVGSNVVTGLRSTAGLSVGMTVLGNGVPANVTITAITSATSVVLSSNATQTINRVPLDFAPLSPAAVQPQVASLTLGEVTNGGRGEGLRGTLTIVWSDNVSRVPAPGAIPGLPDPPVISSINYTYDNIAIDDGGSSPWTDIDLVPSSTPRPEYQFNFQSPSLLVPFLLPGEIAGPIITGSVKGTIFFEDDVISGNAASPANKGLPALEFRTDARGAGTLYFGDQTYAEIDWLRVSGTIASTSDTATISLVFSNRYATASAPAGSVRVNPGTVQVGDLSFLRSIQDPNSNSFTLFAGHDVSSQLDINLLTSGSTVNVDSRVVVATPGLTSNVRDVVLAATNVNIKSQVVTQDQIAVYAETLLVDAAVAAPERFDLSIANDPGNDLIGGPVRGRLQLSPSGSLSGAVSPTIDSASVPTGVINVLATQADVYVEGIANGTRQDWLMRSTQYVTGLAPYEFSTRSPATGVDTGLIRGDTVSIVLGNDAPTPLDGSIAYNTLDLNTQVRSLRIKAATQQVAGTVPDPSKSGPFPYLLSIREQDDIDIDAVAASGLPLSIRSGGNMRFTSALATASDVTLEAASSDADAARLTVSAPLSTTKGQIRLVADNVAVNNMLAVTNASQDEYRDDIWITARSGDISLAGLVSAVNRVKLEQFSPLQDVVVEDSYAFQPALPLAIPDNGVAVATIDVTDDFVFNNLAVEIDITHPFVGDLAGTLIAPDGSRYRLFERNGGTGNNFSGTIFDSQAVDANGNPLLLSQGVPPYTGRFRPVDSLDPLSGRSFLGQWRLEVADLEARDTGLINRFVLRSSQTTKQPSDRRIFGQGRIVADELVIEAQGAVGNPDLLPTDTRFWLRTDVDRLTGVVGRSVSIDELNDISVTSLRANGFVSLRANGSDPVAGANAGNPALQANLVDITGLDVASPNGSVDVLFDTARDVELGNALGLATGRSLNSLAAGNVKIRSTAGGITVLDAPVAGNAARSVRAATTSGLGASSYDPGTPGVFPSRLSGSGNLATKLGVPGPALRVGDRILVKDQVAKAQNGVYTVTSLTTSAWTLTRALDSDTAAELPSNTFVRVMDPKAGQSEVYRLAVGSGGFGSALIDVLPIVVATDIGSNDPNDKVTFVVTTAAGTNTAAGSLGKMISLRQKNTARLAGDPTAAEPQLMDFMFSAALATDRAPIRLTQQLPDITTAIVIDGSRRFPIATPVVGRSTVPTIDGSRITQTSSGRSLVASDIVNGLTFRGAGADGSVIANVTIGGFTRTVGTGAATSHSAAVEVVNSAGMLVNNVTLGANEAGLRLDNGVGVRFTGARMSSATVLNSRVFASRDSGIKVAGGATGVTVVGTTVGKTQYANKVGVAFDSGVNQFGVGPVVSGAAAPRGTATLVDAVRFSLPASYAPYLARLKPGLGVTGLGIVPTNAKQAATIVSVTPAGVVTIAGGTVTAGGLVNFGNFVYTTVRGTTVVLPASIDLSNVFLGQSVTSEGIAGGSTIKAINRQTGEITLSHPKLDEPLIKTGLYAISFGNGRRNTVQQNLTGLVLSGGATTVVNTSIFENIFNGIEIRGSGSAGRHHSIGTSSRQSATSNAIYGNGGWGIFIGSNVSPAVKETRLKIQGNYLGTTSENIVPSTFANKKGNIGHVVSGQEIVFDGPEVNAVTKAKKYKPAVATGLDSQGNQHGRYQGRTGGGTSGGTSGGVR